MRKLIVILLFFVASGASAQSWSKASDGTGGTVTFLKPNEGLGVAFFRIAEDSSTDSSPLGVGACPKITVETVTAPAAGSELEVYLRAVNSLTDTCSTGRLLLADLNGGGVDYLPMRGDHGHDEDGDGTSLSDVFWGFGPVPSGYVCIDVTAPPGTGGDGGADTGYVVVTCVE